MAATTITDLPNHELTLERVIPAGHDSRDSLQRDRFALLADLWGAVAQPDLSVDLVLHSSSEAARRAKEPGCLVYVAMHEGVLLDGQA